jgi:hypothetical protein
MVWTFVFGILALAAGHGYMEAPQPRAGTSAAGNNKGRNRGPCGAGTQLQTQGSPVATYVAGQQVQITWRTTIPHGGTCRISLTTESVGVPADVDGTGRLDGTKNGVYQLTNDFPCCKTRTRETATITIPEGVSCTNCVLQWFWDGDSNYYNCADISIAAAPTPAPTLAPTPVPTLAPTPVPTTAPTPAPATLTTSTLSLAPTLTLPTYVTPKPANPALRPLPDTACSEEDEIAGKCVQKPSQPPSRPVNTPMPYMPQPTGVIGSAHLACSSMLPIVVVMLLQSCMSS